MLSARWLACPGILCTLFVAACGDPRPSDLAAVEYVVASALPPAPQTEGERIAMSVSASWEATSPSEPVPERVLRATGLPERASGTRPTGDSTLVVLDLFKPIVYSPDSILVHVEWLVFEPGRSAFWGNDYDFYLRCRRRCELTHRYGPGALN